MACMVSGSTIVLSGDVGDMGWYFDEADRGFTSTDVIMALAQIGDGKDVTVRLNSGGGIATEGSAIHAALARHKGRKTIFVEGVAASAASIIAMAGDEVVMCLGAVMMIHDPAALTMGTVVDHEGTIAGLTALGNAMAGVYAAKSRQPVEACRADMQAEIWMTPDQAVAKGYADRVEGAADTAVEPAAFPYTAYHHAPARMVALARAKHWDRIRKPTAQAATTPQENGAAMPTEDEIQARIDAAVAAEREKHKTPEPPPAPVASRADAAAIAKACLDGGVPAMAESLLAEGVTLAVARDRVAQAAQIKDAVAVARRTHPAIAEGFADTLIAQGKTVAQAHAALFQEMVAKGAGAADDGQQTFHRSGTGGANAAARAPGGPTSTVRERGKALMAAAVKRMGMTPKMGA